MDDFGITTKRLKFDKHVSAYIEAPISPLFLKGPIPLDWISAAAKLPGKTINVGMALWWLHGMSKGKPFKITSKALAFFHVSNDAAYDALARLEQAGLAKLLRRPGRRPVVTVLVAGPANARRNRHGEAEITRLSTPAAISAASSSSDIASSAPRSWHAGMTATVRFSGA